VVESHSSDNSRLGRCRGVLDPLRHISLGVQHEKTARTARNQGIAWRNLQAIAKDNIAFASMTSGVSVFAGQRGMLMK